MSARTAAERVAVSVHDRLRQRVIEADPPAPLDRWGRPLTGPCLVWTGATDQDGYGLIWDSTVSRSRRVHRVAFEIDRGEPPHGPVRHLCQVRACVAADHLQAPTRSTRPGNGSKTHCPKGHPYDAENTRYTSTGRACRACDRERWREEHGIPLDAPLRREQATCKNGHPWTDANTYWVARSREDPTPRRQCKTCKRQRSRKPRT
ncbi:HNH endonuclease [Spirillospora sp. NPDC047279]|uniref:HNH endonuclease n=1 Tax=Spirillospora sp. NPDC047279 TaxID=3155478 RepID=UPI0034066107